ncbi:MAG: hypothetical protein CL872_01580 [Dehalococcoidaceae bacterium]|nr:hypothetical protein [Dehalococcoidaceae bacterium]
MNKYVQRVQEVLTKHNFSGEIVTRDQTTKTAQEAAEVSGVTVGQIVKSLIFKNASSDEAILILVSGKNRVNVQLFEETTNLKLAKADAAYVLEHTGFHIGGVPPVGHLKKVQTFIDRDLFDYDEIWASAGTEFSVFKSDALFIEKISNATQIQVN